MHKSIPIVGIVAAGSNAGKTTLITKLIAEFTSREIRVSVIKHAHHAFDIDHKGKDSYNIREAGAIQTLIASNKRWALMTEIAAEPNLDDLIPQINPSYADLILVEGFKNAAIPKIEVHRPSLNMPLLAALQTNTPGHPLLNSHHELASPCIYAVASDTTLELDLPVPVLDLNNTKQIADFIIKNIMHK